ncbi:MAG TPA: alpha/beta hydrolase, partial [Polyangiaceae bacterium]|nr:alpha/beta hydrolase [Polyangiaceae bacterium]
EVGRSAVLIGHSYGGLVISRAAADRRDIQRLVYVAAMILDGDDVYLKRVGAFPAAPLNALVKLTADGNFVIPPDAAAACFYNECDDRDARDAAARLRPTAAVCLSGPVGAEPWRSIPATYLVCERDRAIHPEFQRWMSTRAAHVVTFDTDHSPFMSRVPQFAEFLDTVARD